MMVYIYYIDFRVSLQKSPNINAAKYLKQQLIDGEVQAK